MNSCGEKGVVIQGETPGKRIRRSSCSDGPGGQSMTVANFAFLPFRHPEPSLRLSRVAKRHPERSEAKPKDCLGPVEGPLTILPAPVIRPPRARLTPATATGRPTPQPQLRRNLRLFTFAMNAGSGSGAVRSETRFRSAGQGNHAGEARQEKNDGGRLRRRRRIDLDVQIRGGLQGRRAHRIG